MTHYRNWRTIPLEAIFEMFPVELAEFKETGELDQDFYEALFEHWMEEMPYGTAKARDGDPYEWIGDRLSGELENS